MIRGGKGMRGIFEGYVDFGGLVGGGWEYCRFVRWVVWDNGGGYDENGRRKCILKVERDWMVVMRVLECRLFVRVLGEV